jgi:hypothetical protein
MAIQNKTRDLIAIAIGILLFLICGRYRGPLEVAVHSYGSNLTFSFIAYYLFRLSRIKGTDRKQICALFAALLVTASELAQLIGWYSGIFDPLDFLFNLIGVTLAWAIDIPG